MNEKLKKKQIKKKEKNNKISKKIKIEPQSDH